MRQSGSILGVSSQVSTTGPKYVIITPAKNEEGSIDKTIESVLSQTIRPSKWVIVDDGSTDSTAEIVSSYLSEHDFMHLLKVRDFGGRDFAKKVAAFNLGFSFLQGVECSYVGNLDADISLPPDYYERVIGAFECNPRLGIAGGMVHTRIGDGFVNRDTTLDSVGGCVQLFRKECFEQIGGYMPLSRGGIDAAAEIIARMRGWSVQKVPHADVYEHRRTGTAQHGALMASYREGIRFYSLGYCTVFYLLRCIYRLTDEPVIMGSILSLAGFLFASLRRYPVCLPPQAVAYLRSEQIGKLKKRLIGRVQEAAPAA